MTRQSDRETPEVIVFDLGGVLVDWNPRYLFRKLFDGNDAAMEDFLGRVCNHDWNERQDAGRPFAEAMALATRQHPEYADMIQAYFDRWPEMLAGAIDGTVAILEGLKRKGMPLYALTNWSAETFPHALRRFEFLRHFDGIVVSGDERLIKPDPRFFKVLFTRYALTPSRCLFIDDVEKNVAGAKACGMHAVRFTGPEALRADLTALGVI